MVDNNVFLISDASYSMSGFAGLGVRDTHTGKDYSKKIANIRSVHEAEMAALLFSIKIALENKYKNVVFIYDCLGLPVHHLKDYISAKFAFCQFLWLKRYFTKDADVLSKKALHLSEFICCGVNQKTNIGQKKGMKDSEIIDIFQSFGEAKIITACLYVATKQESEVIKKYLSGNHSLKRFIKIKNKNVNLYRFLYHILPEDYKSDFFIHIRRVVPRIKHATNFKHLQRQGVLSDKIREILSVIKKSNTSKI